MADDKPTQLTRRAFLERAMIGGGAAVAMAGGAWGAVEWKSSDAIKEQANEALQSHNLKDYFNLRRQQEPHDTRFYYAAGVATAGTMSSVSGIALMAFDQYTNG